MARPLLFEFGNQSGLKGPGIRMNKSSRRFRKMKQRTNLTTIGFSILVIILALNHPQRVQAESFSTDPGGSKHELAEFRLARAVGGFPQFRDGQPGRQGRHGRGNGIDLDMLTSEYAITKLGISEEQIKRLTALRYENQRRLISLEADLKHARLKFHELMDQNIRDSDSIMFQLGEIGKLRTEQQKLEVGKRLAVEKTLTDEQLDRVRERIRGGREGRYKRGMRPQGGHHGSFSKGGHAREGRRSRHGPRDKPGRQGLGDSDYSGDVDSPASFPGAFIHRENAPHRLENIFTEPERPIL